jgi:alkylation response protein AidB-like acyl-CoA dehydrogenase
LKHKGITAFTVDAYTEGFMSAYLNHVVFDNVKVDVDDILGEVGIGYISIVSNSGYADPLAHCSS